MRKERIQTNIRTFSGNWQWHGDNPGRETCFYTFSPSVTYLEEIFFVWLSGIPFITGHLSTKEKGKHYPWVHVKPSMGHHQNLPMPAVQAVQYEFKDTPSLSDMTVKTSAHTNPCASPDYHLSPQRKTKEDRHNCTLLPRYNWCYFRFAELSTACYPHISIAEKRCLSEARRCLIISSFTLRTWHLSSLIILAFWLDVANSWETVLSWWKRLLLPWWRTQSFCSLRHP